MDCRSAGGGLEWDMEGWTTRVDEIGSHRCDGTGLIDPR